MMGELGAQIAGAGALFSSSSELVLPTLAPIRAAGAHSGASVDPKYEIDAARAYRMTSAER